MTDCVICSAKQRRIEELEERVEALEQQLEAEIVHPPFEWGLGPQQALFAQCLCRGPRNRKQLLAALEASYPSSEGRSDNHVSVVMSKLRQKLGPFGWVIESAGTWPGLYRIHTEQETGFRAAMRGEGSHIFMPEGKGQRAAA